MAQFDIIPLVMLKVKLTRIGKKNQPQYRIIINEAKSKRDGAFTDQIGHYNPLAKPPAFTIDLPKYQEWLKKGAQPTDTVRQLVAKFTKKAPTAKKTPKKSTKK